MGYKRAAFATFFFFFYICVGQDLDGHQESAGVGALEPIRVAFATEGVWELGGFQVPLGLM